MWRRVSGWSDLTCQGLGGSWVLSCTRHPMPGLAGRQQSSAKGIDPFCAFPFSHQPGDG